MSSLMINADLLAFSNIDNCCQDWVHPQLLAFEVISVLVPAQKRVTMTLFPKLHSLWKPSYGRARCSWLLLLIRYRRSKRRLTLVALVREAPSGGENDEQCHHDQDDIQALEHRCVSWKRWKEPQQERVECCIGGCDKQHRKEQAASCIIEDPGDDDRCCCDTNNVLDERNADADEARSGSIVSWDQEQREGQQAPQYA